MLNQETKRKIDSCRDMLVGKLPDPKAQIEQITYALIYKFMGDMDKASVALGGKASFFVNGYEQYAWDKLMATNIGGKQRLDLYSEAIAKLSLNPHLPQLFRDIFKDAFLPYRDPETLNMFLKEINWFTYTHSEDLGDAFEYLLSVMSSQGDAGQFRTPRHIIDFIVSVVDPKKDETILDPACGTAGFLISAYKHILQQNAGENPGDKLTPDEKTALMNQMVGYDISPDMVRLSLVNMYLHGFPEPHIYEYDTLTDEGRWEDSFDVIMANPPFMSPKGGIRPHKRFSIQANRSEVLFVDYIAEHLMPNGRAGVIVPEGIIFQSGNAYKALRKMLVDNYLFCVVSLPAGVFNPYSGVKTSILFMDRTLAKKTDNILFVKIENDGFDLGAQRREVAGSDFPQSLINIKTCIQYVRNGKEFNITSASNILLVAKQQLGENGDYNLSPERYKDDDRVINISSWPKKTIGETCVLSTGGTPKSDIKEYYNNGNIRWLVSGDIHKGEIFDCENHITQEGLQNSNAKYLPINSVLIALNGQGKTRGSVALLRTEATCNQSIVAINPRDFAELIPEFLYYQLKARYQEIRNLTGDTERSGLNMPIIRNLKVIVPPLNIQQEIVAEIESYQKIIDGALQVVENYKPQIKIDPAWPLVELGTVARLINGRAYKQEELLANGPTPVLRVGNFFSNRGWYYSDLKLEEDKYCDVGDLLYAWSASFGPKIWEGPRAIFHYHIWKIEITGEIDKHFLFYLLAADSAKIKSEGNGIAMMHTTKGDMEKRPFPFPPLSVQQEIVAQIEKEQQLVDANKELIQIYEQKIKDKIAEVWET